MATNLAPLLAQQSLPRAACRYSLSAQCRPAPPPPPLPSRRVIVVASKTKTKTKTKTARGFVGVIRCSVDGVEALPRSVPVRVAYELQQAGHRYLDVRTEGEFSAGHPQGAVNIPYMHTAGSASGMTKNTHFLEQVSTLFGKDEEIIVGCQSGKRSLMAATELCAAGFTAVTDIAGGFSSWRENELPVNQNQ